MGGVLSLISDLLSLITSGDEDGVAVGVGHHLGDEFAAGVGGGGGGEAVAFADAAVGEEEAGEGLVKRLIQRLIVFAGDEIQERGEPAGASLPAFPSVPGGGA